MNANAVIRLMSLLSLWMWTGQGQTFQPQLSSFQASVTSNTVILKQPYCIFNQTCSGCVIWLVAALTSATGNFDAQVNVTFAPSVLNVSPYPTAFNSPSTNFFVTQVGPLANFPCNQSPNDLYFIVGAEGKCSGSNCNGILPDGSIVSFKYLLIDPNNQTIVSLSNWSISIPLVQIQNPQNITVGLIARSGAMVVITTILCVAVGLLLLLFFIMLCVAYCCKKGTSHATSPRTVKSSFRIPRYDIHSLKGRKHPYDNQAFDPEVKKYSTSDTLPKSGIQTQKL